MGERRRVNESVPLTPAYLSEGTQKKVEKFSNSDVAEKYVVAVVLSTARPMMTHETFSATLLKSNQEPGHRRQRKNFSSSSRIQWRGLWFQHKSLV